ncbi:MAG: hypothetical protein QHH24_01870 [Candidatus Bathyarchaeota archaeon]|nr:hypothetical protein [Candidatus Bathyarchaeota archaeon]
MEVECFPRLSKKQQKVLPKNYVPLPVEGMYSIDGKHPDGIIYVYVGYCDWEKNFDYCLKEFLLTIFHEAMHIMFPEMEDHIPYAEKILADILDRNPEQPKPPQRT